MRFAVATLLLVLSAGCGRVGFPAGPAGDAGMDATVDAGGDANRDGGSSDAGDAGDARTDAAQDAARDASTDAGADPDAMVGEPAPSRAYVDTFSTGSTTFVPIAGAATVIPPGSRDWLVIGSGRLRWAGGAAATPQVEARLTVRGVQRGLGGSTGLNGSSGPFQFFDVVAAGTEPIDVRVEVRSPGAEGAAEQVRLVAVPLQQFALTFCTSGLPVPALSPEGPVLSLEVPAGANFVFAQIAIQDTFGGDVTVRLNEPSGGDWPQARALHHGRLNYQAFMLSRFFTNPGTVTMTVQVSGASEARMGHARICAIPSTALAVGASHFATDTTLVSTTSAVLDERQRLNLIDARPGRYLVLQNVAAYTPTGAFATTRVAFKQDGVTLHSVDLDINQMGLSPTYGYADIVDTAPDSSFSIFLAEPTAGAEIRSYEAISYAIEL